MGMPGMSEWIIILLVIVILFGGKKIPELAKGIGKGIKDFKKAMNEDDEPTPQQTKATDSKAVESKDKETKDKAAAGIGRPINIFGSILKVVILNLASLIAPNTTYKATTRAPNFP